MKTTVRLVPRLAAILASASLGMVGCGTDSESPSLHLGDGTSGPSPDTATGGADTVSTSDSVVGPSGDAGSGGEDAIGTDDVSLHDVAAPDTTLDDVVLEDVTAPHDTAGQDDTTIADDGAILPPYDAGDPFGDAGPLGTPEWVPMEVLVDGTTCPALTACGGELLGTWDVAGGCFDYPSPAALKQCPGALLTATGQARGRVTFDGAIAVRKAQSEVTTDLFVPSLCASFAGGCPAIQTMITASFPGAKCVTTAKSDCECQARFTFDIDDGDLYKSENNQIVSTSSGKRWDYCVTDQDMRYRDVSPSGVLEPGTIQLRRK